MDKWNTNAIVTIIREALEKNNHPYAKRFDDAVQIDGQWGDWDTEHIVVTDDNGNESLFIGGFRCGDEGVIDTPSQADIEMIEVSDGQDSRGGLNSNNLQLSLAYAIICATLRQNGFDVVDTQDDYF